MCPKVCEVSVHDRTGFGKFLSVPFHIYNGTDAWVAPLNRELKRKLDPNSNPFFDYGSVSLLVASDANGRSIGRIAVISNPWHERLYGQKMGFFGLFECTNDHATAGALMREAESRLAQLGCTDVLGPVNLTTNDESGLLFDRFDESPTFMCNYCPPYYHELMASAGYSKQIDTLSFMAWHGHPFPEKYYRLVKKVEANPRISIRRFDSRHAADDIQTIADIYNDSFRETWGFVPMSEREAAELGKSLLPISDHDLIWIASCDGYPVGMILGFPDINEIIGKMKGRLTPIGIARLMFGRGRIQGMRIAALGVRPDYRRLGIETLLIHKVHERVHTRPYRRSEFSVVLENNLRMRNLLERFGFKLCRRYRLYRRTIGRGE